MPFSRTEDGKIYQRPFGGMTTALRRGPAGAAHLRRGRPHRPRHAAHALWPVAPPRDRVLRRVFRHRPHHGGWRVPRRRRALPRGRHAASLPRPQDDHRHRRLRPRLPDLHRRAHADRRRRRHGAPRRPAAPGHGVRAVPPDRRLWRRRAHHRGRARRGRLPHQLRRRALHGALRPARQGPRLARCRLARHDDRDSRRPRRRRGEGSHLPSPLAPRPEDHSRAAAGHFGIGAHLRRRRCHARADPGAADRALQHGRHPHELSRRGADQGRRRSGCDRAGPDGGGRGGVRFGARRQSPRLELAHRPGRVRPRGGAARRRRRSRKAPSTANSPPTPARRPSRGSIGCATPTVPRRRRNSGTGCRR